MQQTEGFYFPPVKSSLHHNVVCATYISFNSIQYSIYLQHLQNIAHRLDCQKPLTKKGKQCIRYIRQKYFRLSYKIQSGSVLTSGKWCCLVSHLFSLRKANPSQSPEAMLDPLMNHNGKQPQAI